MSEYLVNYIDKGLNRIVSRLEFAHSVDQLMKKYINTNLDLIKIEKISD